MKKALFAGIALAMILTGCSAEAPAPPAPSATVTESATVDTSKIVTKEVKDAAGVNGGSVTKAMETEPGRITVETSLVDPKGAEGSPEAKTAIKICEAVSKMDGISYVSVQEKDGTSWVLFGHPSVPKGECAEI